MNKTLLVLLVVYLAMAATSGVIAQQGIYAPGKGAPETLHGRVEAAYMISSDLYKYLVDLNLWFDFGQWNDAVFFFNGGLLTYISNDDDSFDPERIRGTVQPGLYLKKNCNIYYFYVKHQSFHDIDFYDNLDESYEIYTLAYMYTGKFQFFGSVGKFENQKDNNYDWEFTGWIQDPDIARAGDNPIYASAGLRYVTESGNPPGNGNFTDYTLELGIQTAPQLRYYLGYRQIHDINQFNGVTDHELLIGAKYGW